MSPTKNPARRMPSALSPGVKPRLTGPFGDSELGAWNFILTDDNVLHRLPVVHSSGPAIQGGRGPGGLTWSRTHEHGFDGLVAVYRDYTFQIWCLHRTEPDTSQSKCALVSQRTNGTWEALALGTPDALKEHAGRRVEEIIAERDRELRKVVEAMMRQGRSGR